MSEIDRVRWRCRRGMLELDLVLERFMGSEYGKLAEEEKKAFQKLLDFPDHELWDMVCGRMTCPDPRLEGVAQRLRAL